MRSFFSQDSWFMASLSRMTDLILLNLLFVLCSIPVVTLGPAAAAMYTLLFRMGTERESGIVRPFFAAFRENLKQGLVLWVGELALAGAIGFDISLFFHMTGAVRYVYILILCLAIAGLLASGYLFPLISLFRNSNLKTVGCAVALSIANLPRSFLIMLLNLVPVLTLVLAPMMFFQAAILWVVIYFAFAAYLNSLLLKKVFAPFLEAAGQENSEPNL